ncbi:acetyl-CoA synthetase-like protein [Moniliophthora roreri MCA 2997]|uniref:Acetyl-CoA synthetase-like protein n=1 Tax=Moniliophthora roreri (strain MCA 2997) TaxID=1381753 RepID=V2WYG3_MONRO|nr:acetyl-CoA synthetase-like protein [Moniliophthora roreri MCA 2997]
MKTYNEFCAPPLDGDLSIPELYDWHNTKNHGHPIFLFPDDDGAIHHIIYSQFFDAHHRAGYLIGKQLQLDLSQDRKLYPTVAVLSTADTISTFTVLIGLLRLGVVPFPISPRFSPRVVAHLLQKAGVSHVLLNDDPCLKLLVEEAVSIVEKEAKGELYIGMYTLPQYEELYVDTWFPRLPKKIYDRSSTAMFVHSSNSSSDYPKAVPWTVLMQSQHARIPLKSQMHDLRGQVMSCHSIELFHTLGLFFLFWTPASGLIMATFKPASPAVLPSAENCFHGIKTTQATYALTHTRFLEAWAPDEAKVNHLKTLKGVLSGGKILKQAAGDTLARRGVRLCNCYGSTEAGQISAIPTDEPGTDWDYFQRNPQCTLEFEDQGDGTFHAIVIPTKDQAPNLTNTQWRGKDAFATGDLLVPHPVKKDYWKVLGRMDDQIMLASGEVVNPVRPENIINSNQHVRSSLLFGRAKTHLGLLVELNNTPPALTPTAIEAARDLIWPSVQLVNSILPTYCSITRNMVIFVSHDKPLVYNPKGAPKRAKAFLQYQDEIDALYKGVVDPFLERHPAQYPTSTSSGTTDHDVSTASVLKALNLDEDIILSLSGYLGTKARSPTMDIFMPTAASPIFV